LFFCFFPLFFLALIFNLVLFFLLMASLIIIILIIRADSFIKPIFIKEVCGDRGRIFF